MLPAEHMKVSSPKPLVVPESSKRRFTGTSRLPDPHNLLEIHALDVSASAGSPSRGCMARGSMRVYFVETRLFPTILL